MKGLLNRMKGKQHHRDENQKSRVTQMQNSQQLGLFEPEQGRSRAISSNGGGGLREIDENLGVRFIDYKKGKQLPYLIKNE